MGMGNFGFVGGIGMLLFWGLAIALLVWIVRALLTPGARRPAARSARDVLEERYARGAIERDEFEARKRLLGE